MNRPIPITTNTALSQIIPKDSIDSLTVYLPAYLRLKFKNFVSLDLHNLYGQMNATLIYSIYYGALFDWLKQLGSKQQDLQKVTWHMKNSFVMNFSKDQAIQLTQGKQQTVSRKDALKPPKKQDRKQENVKIKRNIQLTTKEDKKARTIQFTLRKNFRVHLEPHQVFLTPFQVMNTILQITFQSITVEKINPCKLIIQINLMDTKLGAAKVSYSEQKKFGQYGIVLSGLEAVYSNDKLVACNPNVFLEKGADSKEKTRFFAKKETDKRIKRFKKELLEVRANDKDSRKEQKIEKYIRLYLKEFLTSKYKYKQNNIIDESMRRQLFVFFNEKEIQSYENSRLFEYKKKSDFKLQACKYASFKIPLYKLPITSVATIFVPLWLLAVLSLGVFFQDQNLADRIMSIASLALAFIAFIPTIRQQIPPSPQIVLVQILVYLTAMPSLFALGQSIQIHLNDKFVFDGWSTDGLFLTSIILNIGIFVIVVVLMLLHYCYWQKRYKKPIGKDEKFNRKYWFNNVLQRQVKQMISGIRYGRREYEDSGKKGPKAGMQQEKEKKKGDVHELIYVIDDGGKQKSKKEVQKVVKQMFMKTELEKTKNETK